MLFIKRPAKIAIFLRRLRLSALSFSERVRSFSKFNNPIKVEAFASVKIF